MGNKVSASSSSTPELKSQSSWRNSLRPKKQEKQDRSSVAVKDLALFISYNMNESEIVANMLFFAFNQLKGKIYLAEKQALNQAWKDNMFAALNDATHALILFTNNYAKTKYSKLEFDRIIAQGKETVIIVDNPNEERLNSMLPKDNPKVKVVVAKSPWESYATAILDIEISRVIHFQQGQRNLAYVYAKSLASEVYLDIFKGLATHFGTIFDETCYDRLLAVFETSHIPMVLDRKPGILIPVSLEKRENVILDKIAIIVEKTAGGYDIYHPKDRELNTCTMIHVNESCFKSAMKVSTNSDCTAFEGSLVELLEKHKGSDDTQVFFLSMPLNKTYDEAAISYVQIVLDIVVQTYN